MYPPIEPHQSGHLLTSEGHAIGFEVSGNPEGQPVLFFHGGPGSFARPDHRRYFDPAHYRIVLFDQRGCGKSTPRGSIVANTTAHLIEDIERLRAVLGVSKWTLFGGSWGSTLALGYAQAHPDHVRGIVVRGIFLCSAAELEWYFVSLRHFIPEAWRELYSLSPQSRWPQLIDAYQNALHSTDPGLVRSAAGKWNGYESAIMSIGEAVPTVPPVSNFDEAVARARIQVHYLQHRGFMEDRSILTNMPRIAHLPGIIVHGRMDFVCPPVTAFELRERWPKARLTIVESAKHAASHPAMEQELVAAADAARMWSESRAQIQA